MSLDEPRDPQRNRQYYEDRHLLPSKQTTVTFGPIANETNRTTTPAVPPPSPRHPKSEAVAVPQTATPPAEPTTSARTTPRIVTTHAPPPGRGSAGGVGAADLGRLVKTTWNDLKELLGFVPNCMNGGTRTGGTTCRCPKLFEGALCDKRICLNGGKLERAKYGPVSWDCKCPTPQYIEGAHCETVRCANNAVLRTEPNGSWWCDCSDSIFYSGRFCEEFSAPYAVFAVPLACLLLFALCIAVCQMDLCPRRRRIPRHTRRSADSGQPHITSRSRRRAAAGVPPRSRAAPSTAQRAAVTQELLIAEDRAMCRRGVAYPQGIVAPYVIRLDTIPHFNPNMIGGVDPLSPAKPLEPPPSYEQAVSAPPVPQPPSYTETADERVVPPPPPIIHSQPPPPNRQPPLPPNS
ncbi:unnamed protein product [Cylicocyclus nassatus]|uniref:EGF-like domain-containing protein n=1 Tax=Cylicocyclus nassatus TaxID=53992 RepID=A0AA36GNX6_CYLNA|nr:unnamed protein product [Cylicocyclus nassatus]